MNTTKHFWTLALSDIFFGLFGIIFSVLIKLDVLEVPDWFLIIVLIADFSCILDGFAFICYVTRQALLERRAEKAAEEEYED